MADITAAALRRHVEVLAGDIGPRVSGPGAGLIQAAEYIGAEFRTAGLEVTDQGYDWRGEQVANLIADLPRDSRRRDQPYYVVGAHYDTVAASPGADDNTSAVAVLIELARRVAAAGAPVRYASSPSRWRSCRRS